MAGGIIGVSVSALNATQAALQTTGHNIANANTPGYTRQQVSFAARQPQFTGAGYLGQGVDVNTISRVYSQFLTGQVLSEQSQAAYLSTQNNQIQQINNVIADPTAGVSPSIQEFFSSINNVATAPESQPARQALLNSANAMAARFQSLSQRLTDTNNSLSSQISNSVTLVNSYSVQIAALNQNIVLQTSTGGQPPNDLLDQRDQLISQLNTEVKATVLKQSDGAYNVYVGNGQSLVVGGIAFKLSANQSKADPNKQEIVYNNQDGTTTTLQQSSLSGGNLGGFLTFRDTILANSQNSLGRVAMGVAALMNQQHQLGQDLNGVLGGNFFVQPTPAVYANKLNTGTGVLSVTVANPSDYSALTNSDYSVKFNGANYTMTRLSDNQVVYSGGMPPPAPVDGLTLASGGGFDAAGDSFLIRPTVNGARDLAVAVTDPTKIAAGMPIRTNTTISNAGSGVIAAGSVDTPAPPATPITPDPAHPSTDLNLKNSVTLTFTSATTFDVLDTTTGLPLAAGVPYVSGNNISYNGWTTQITGVPAAGDTFTVGSNTAATADSRNALLMASLQTKNTLGAVAGGAPTLSFQAAYAQWVSDVGNKARELQVTSTAQTAMAAQSVATQQSFSGVNLDEEAGNLLRFQRAYQAAGKAMQIANVLFDTILSLGK